MILPRFFTDNINSDFIIITGDDAKHISKVLRLKEGDTLTACDMCGIDYIGTIDNITSENVSVKINEKHHSQAEPDIEVTLYQAMPKGDKLELIIQKAVELGVHRIVPILTHRCVSRPDEKSMTKKLSRLQKIAEEAAKQSGRGRIPKICEMLSYKNALAQMQEHNHAIIFYEEATAPLNEMLKNIKGSLAIMIGSEGGFELSEIEDAKALGIPTATLGKRILRCETAPLAALSVIMYETGNM